MLSPSLASALRQMGRENDLAATSRVNNHLVTRQRYSMLRSPHHRSDVCNGVAGGNNNNGHNNNRVTIYVREVCSATSATRKIRYVGKGFYMLNELSGLVHIYICN
jgi:hypothetical protein